MQGRHAVAFLPGWYFPGSHSAQIGMPGSSANVPGLHQAYAFAPVLQAAPLGQTVHSSDDVSPNASP